MSHPHDEARGRRGSLLATFPVPVLLTLAALSAVSPMATDMYLPAFTAMADDLDASAPQVQATLTTFMVGAAIGQLVLGVLSDRVGRRPLLVWGTVLALVAGIGTVVAPTLGVLLVARFVQGLGGAAGMVLARAVITDRARGVAAAQALNLVMAIMGVAPVVAPIVGGVLVGPIGWRGILGVVVVFTALLLVAVLAFLPESLPPERRSDAGLRALTQGAGELLRRPYVVRLLALASVVFAALMAYISAAPFLTQSVLGMSVTGYTLVFALCASMMIVATSTSGALARRVPVHRQVRVAVPVLGLVDLALAAVCVVWLRAPVDSPALTAVVVVGLVAHVTAIGFVLGNVSALMLTETGRRAGTGSALLGFAQFTLGGLVSPLVGLGGEGSAVAFALVLVVLVLGANLLALPGLRPMAGSVDDAGDPPARL